MGTDAGRTQRLPRRPAPAQPVGVGLRGYFVEADPHGATIRSDFEMMWSTLDGELELRTETWAPRGAATDESLASALAEFDGWVREVLASDKSMDHS